MQSKKTITLVLSFLLIIGIFSAVFVMAAEGVFTIKKVDQNKEPLEDVEFEVYGKPVLTSTFKIKVTKKYETEFHPILKKVTICIESTDGGGVKDSFTVDWDDKTTMSTEFMLKPGSYKIYEEVPDPEGTIDWSVVYHYQTLLTSCEFTINDAGEITISSTPEWMWRIRDFWGNEDNNGPSPWGIDLSNYVKANGSELIVNNYVTQESLQQ